MRNLLYEESDRAGQTLKFISGQSAGQSPTSRVIAVIGKAEPVTDLHLWSGNQKVVGHGTTRYNRD
jgi:hypothetical protein